MTTAIEEVSEQSIAPGQAPDVSAAGAMAAMNRIKQFVPKAQLRMMCNLAQSGESKAFWREKFVELAERIDAMPVTYEQDGQDQQAVAYLHYFVGSVDIYVTEKDMDGDGTLQAYGQADLGDGPEVGYLSIPEYVDVAAMNLDLHFKPATLAKINGDPETSSAPVDGSTGGPAP